VSHSGLAIDIEKYLSRQKKKNYYGNSNISPCQNIPNLQKKKPSKKKPKSFKIL
jgi:hypothetical protein